MYKRLTQGLNDRGFLIPDEENPYDHITDNADWYASAYKYNEEQKKQFDSTGTVAGITDVVASKLWLDFDSEFEIEEARQSALKVIDRLQTKGVSSQDIQVTFSGSKGFGVEVNVNQLLTPKQAKDAALTLAADLPHFDLKVYNASRILRLIGTKHNKTGLYKIPLVTSELKNLSVDEIMTSAKTEPSEHESFRWAAVDCPPDLLKAATVKQLTPTVVVPLDDLDFSKKAKGWSNCKWSLLNGNFKEGERHYPILSIIATCKSLNYPKETAYYMAKSASKLSVQRNGGSEFPKEEIWSEVESVYSPVWIGGSFSCKDGKSEWLSKICGTLGNHRCKHTDMPLVSINDTFDLFKDYAKNYDQNVIKTGIEQLDHRCSLMVGTSNGILAPPGVGKTSLAANILNHNSNNDINSVFFSYDMYHSMVCLRLLQKHTGMKQEQLFNIIKTNPKEALRLKDLLSEEYKNVNFCFKSGQTADEIQETIQETQEHTGKKVKLVVVDYNELVISNIADPTQSSAHTAQRLRQIANDTSTCVVTLLQPSKVFSNPSDEITTYQGAKGSGAIAQSLNLMLSLSRPGFSPRTPEQDKFFTINALKYRQGPLFTLDLSWNGLTGQIGDLSVEEMEELNAIRQSRREENGQNDI